MTGRTLEAIATGLFAAALVAGATRAQEPDAQWRATMDEIFEAIQVVLPLSLDGERFADLEERPRILEAMAKLSANADALRQHGASRDAARAYLSLSLARDARDLQRRYEAGQVLEARFLLRELTSTCVACHSRLPSDRSFPLGARFVDETVVAALPLDERAQYEMATRQFDRALATDAALFEAPDTSPADVSLLGLIDEYLEVAIRVKNDPARARATLERFAKRPDLGEGLAADVASWIAALRALETREPNPDPLAEARSLLDAAAQASSDGDDRVALVQYIAASAPLHRFVDAHPEGDADVAEAYYLLGVIESRIGRARWLSQSEAFLEASIRQAPGSPFADDAFELLSSVVVSGWTGSSGVHVPPDVQARLEELSALVEASRPAPTAP